MPIYNHTCKHCTFLCTDKDLYYKPVDLYLCEKGNITTYLGPVIKARFGNDGHNFDIQMLSGDKTKPFIPNLDKIANTINFMRESWE